jgi:hypothetical protein
MIAWFLGQWRDELPEQLHTRGVEWSSPGRIVRSSGAAVTDPGGGDLLGSPRLDPAYRDFLLGDDWRRENPSSDGQPERTETYATPLRATIRFMERRRPLSARWLRALGRAGGDWREVGVTFNLPDELAEHVTAGALREAWFSYREEPR